MAMVVQQNQLFVLGVSKRRDVERSVSVHQDDLVIGKGRRGTEGRQGIVAARTQGHLGFVMELAEPGFFAVEFPLLVESTCHFGCWSRRALATTRALAQQSSSSFLIRMTEREFFVIV